MTRSRSQRIQQNEMLGYNERRFPQGLQSPTTQGLKTHHALPFQWSRGYPETLQKNPFYLTVSQKLFFLSGRLPVSPGRTFSRRLLAKLLSSFYFPSVRLTVNS